MEESGSGAFSFSGYSFRREPTGDPEATEETGAVAVSYSSTDTLTIGEAFLELRKGRKGSRASRSTDLYSTSFTLVNKGKEPAAGPNGSIFEMR